MSLAIILGGWFKTNSCWQICPFCTSSGPETFSSMRNPAPAVSPDRLEIFLKLLGHSDPKVNSSMLSLLKPMSVHVGVDQASAGLWLNYLNSDNDDIVAEFSQHVHNLVGVRLSSGKSCDNTSLFPRKVSVLLPHSNDSMNFTIFTCLMFKFDVKRWWF